ncbi:MAG: TolC family protein [Candidatus Bruticola sp.]
MNVTINTGRFGQWRMSAIVLSLGLVLAGGNQNAWSAPDANGEAVSGKQTVTVSAVRGNSSVVSAESQAEVRANRAVPNEALPKLPSSAAPAHKMYNPQPVPQPSEAAAAPDSTPADTMLPDDLGEIPNAPKYSMRDAMRMAMKNSPALNSARAAYEQAKGSTEEAYTAGNPTVDFNLQYTLTVPELSADMGGQKLVTNYQHNYKAQLAINQVISTFGRLHYSVLAAQMEEYCNLENYRQALEAQLALTANKYLEVLLAQESVVIASQQLEAQLSSLRQAEALYKGGTVAKFDVLSVRSAATSAELALIEAKNVLRLAKASLCSDMGLPIGTEFNVVPFDWQKIPDNVVSGYSLEESVMGALERRPEVKAAKWAKEAAEARLELSLNSRNPVLSLQSSLANTHSTSMSKDTMWVTGVVLSVPVYDGGVEHAQSKQLKAAVDQLDASLETVRRGVRLDVEQCYYNLNSRWERIVQARVGLEQAAEAYRVAEVRYAAGLSTPTELLDSQSSLVSAKRNLATAKYSYLGANVDWMLATSGAYPFEVDGPLDETDLKADLDAWYVSADRLRTPVSKLINPVKDDNIPSAFKEIPVVEPSLKKLSDQIKSQSINDTSAGQVVDRKSDNLEK